MASALKIKCPTLLPYNNNVHLILRNDSCDTSCSLVYDITLHFFCQGLPGPDGPSGEKGESVSATKLLIVIKF